MTSSVRWSTLLSGALLAASLSAVCAMRQIIVALPPPALPRNPSPPTGTIDIVTTSNLTWTGEGGTSYDLYFGTANPPPFLQTISSGQSFTPTLTTGTTYFWYIISKNQIGNTTGPVWNFRTQFASGSGTKLTWSGNIQYLGAYRIPTTGLWSGSGGGIAFYNDPLCATHGNNGAMFWMGNDGRSVAEYCLPSDANTINSSNVNTLYTINLATDLLQDYQKIDGPDPGQIQTQEFNHNPPYGCTQSTIPAETSEMLIVTIAGAPTLAGVIACNYDNPPGIPFNYWTHGLNLASSTFNGMYAATDSSATTLLFPSSASLMLARVSSYWTTALGVDTASCKYGNSIITSQSWGHCFFGFNASGLTGPAGTTIPVRAFQYYTQGHSLAGEIGNTRWANGYNDGHPTTPAGYGTHPADVNPSIWCNTTSQTLQPCPQPQGIAGGVNGSAYVYWGQTQIIGGGGGFIQPEGSRSLIFFQVVYQLGGSDPLDPPLFGGLANLACYANPCGDINIVKSPSYPCGAPNCEGGIHQAGVDMCNPSPPNYCWIPEANAQFGQGSGGGRSKFQVVLYDMEDLRSVKNNTMKGYEVLPYEADFIRFPINPCEAPQDGSCPVPVSPYHAMGLVAYDPGRNRFMIEQWGGVDPNGVFQSLVHVFKVNP